MICDVHQQPQQSPSSPPAVPDRGAVRDCWGIVGGLSGDCQGLLGDCWGTVGGLSGTAGGLLGELSGDCQELLGGCWGTAGGLSSNARDCQGLLGADVSLQQPSAYYLQCVTFSLQPATKVWLAQQLMQQKQCCPLLLPMIQLENYHRLTGECSPQKRLAVTRNGR